MLHLGACCGGCETAAACAPKRWPDPYRLLCCRGGRYISAAGQSFRDFMEGNLPALPGQHLNAILDNVLLQRNGSPLAQRSDSQAVGHPHLRVACEAAAARLERDAEGFESKRHCCQIK